MDDIYSAIEQYFHMGILYMDIVRIMEMEHECSVSLRHLKRILKQLHLSRRNNYSDIRVVINFIHDQLQKSGKLHGYRWMSVKCRAHDIRCRVEDVRLILSVLDPLGLEQRKKRRLLRRIYSSKGPNYLWHIDSYDKLKRYGVCINGCVDGFSRRIIFMNAYHTSSDPKLIGGYYMESVESLGGCPRMLRGDLGTENCYVRDLQIFLHRHNNDANHRCYLQGPSTSNQRIEYMWSFLRKECTDYWICLFRNMLDEGYFDDGVLDVSLIQFCFLHLIQDDLDETIRTWNRHLIRPSRNARAPNGRPDVMYYMPELFETRYYLCSVSEEQIHACKGECRFREPIPCDRDIYDLCCITMKENGYTFPSDPQSAVNLYLKLRRILTRYMNQ